MATINQLLSCPKKAYFNSLGIKTEKGIAIYAGDVVRKILKQEKTFTALEDEKKVREELEATIPASTFVMKHERNINLDVAAARLARMGNILSARGYIYKDDGEMYYCALPHQTISGFYSFSAEKDGVAYGVKLSYNKPDLSMLKSAAGYIGNDIDSYMMYKTTGLNPLVISLAGGDKASEMPEALSLAECQADKGIVGKYLYSVDFSALDKEAIQQLEDNLEQTSKILVFKNADKNEKNCRTCPWQQLCEIEDIDYSDILNDVPEATEKPVIDFKWTDSQLALINTKCGETRVYAVAGSGKTTCIANTVVNAVKTGTPISEITLCTFTNKGVQEIKEKIAKQIEAEKVDLKAEDFHVVSLNGLGYEIIKRSCALQSKNEPKIISDNDFIEMIIKAADNHQMVEGLNYANPMLKTVFAKGAVLQLKAFIDVISRSNRERLTTDKQVNAVLLASDEAKCIKDKDGIIDAETCKLIAEIYNDVMDQMQEANLITYDDQITQGLRILNSSEKILNEFRDKCRYLIVDEFQDTSLVQMELLDKLYVPSQTTALIVVGDAMQAIMGFRGVGNENILKFKELYPNAVTINMNRNFRSTREICELAEKIMKTDGIDAVLESDIHGDNPIIEDSTCKEEGNQAAVEQVNEWVKAGVPMSDIAVIARTRNELLDIRRGLSSMGIPTMISVSEFLKDDNQVVAAANLAAFLMDNSKIKELAIWCRRSNKSAFDDADDVDGYLGEQAAYLDAEFAGKDDQEMYTAFLEKLKNTFDTYSKPMQAVITADEENRKSLKRFAKKLHDIITCGSKDGTEKDDKVYDAVSLTTVHSAKGREWNNVVVCTNGFKDATGLKDKDGETELTFNSEEIRILFVAVTRAKKNLAVMANGYWKACLNGEKVAKTSDLLATGVKVSVPKPKAKK